MHASVGIIGGCPAGLLLARQRQRADILERSTVESPASPPAGAELAANYAGLPIG
jgi:hypothetical protein